MKRKYYKIDVEDLFCLDNYGLKRDCESPSHINNVFRLDDVYKIRYPLLMKKVTNLQYINFRCKEIRTISNREKALYNVPDYFLVTEIEPNGYFEYTELLTGITFLIPSEVHAKLYNKSLILKTEISEEEVVNLFNDDYIEKIGNLFYLLYDSEKKETVKQELVRKLIKTNKQ